MTKAVLRFVALSVAGLGALSIAACGGEMTDDSGLSVSDADQTSAALGSPDPGGTADADDDDDAEHDGEHHKGDHHKGGKDRCNEHDHDQHKHHRRHKFKVLDRIDGAKDGIITIGSLPPALPERLIARLHVIDANADGLVTKDEVKAWKHARGE